jgi:2Fe-2S ferredoxin
MQKITFIEADGKTHELQVEPGQSIMHVAIDNNIRGILADCGGCCSCATCHCYVDEAWAGRFASATVEETELVQYAFDPLPTSRLSCQLQLTAEHDGIVIRLPQRQI